MPEPTTKEIELYVAIGKLRFALQSSFEVDKVRIEAITLLNKSLAGKGVTGLDPTPAPDFLKEIYYTTATVDYFENQKTKEAHNE